MDSYFWNQFPLWPELSGIYFNIIQGKSSDWGVCSFPSDILRLILILGQTSPAHTYITTLLPKLLLTSFPLSIFSLLMSSRIRTLLLPVGVFVGLISCLAHKEWRFVVYVIPLGNIAGGWGLRWM